MGEFANLLEELVNEDIIEDNNIQQSEEKTETKPKEPTPKEPEQKTEEPEKKEEPKFYSSEELEKLLSEEPNKIDLEKVPETIRPVVSASIKQVEQVKQKEQQNKHYELVLQEANKLKESAKLLAAQEVERHFGNFDINNPEHVTAYNRLVMQVEKQADNMVKAAAIVTRLRAEDGEVFDKAIEVVKNEAMNDPLLRQAWDEADIATLLPIYERAKAKLVKETVKNQTERKTGSQEKTPPNVITPGTGKSDNLESYSPEDLVGLDIDAQAQMLVKMGLLD